MVVAHLNIIGVIVITTDKADAVLIVNPYAVLPFPITLEQFKAVAGRISEVVQDLGGIHHFKLPTSSSFDIPKSLDRNTVKEALRILVSKGLDHDYSV